MSASPSSPALPHWHAYHRRLRRQWWAYLLGAVASGSVFLASIRTHDDNLYAILLIIPLLWLWQAWRIDRRLVGALKIMRNTTYEKNTTGEQNERNQAN